MKIDLKAISEIFSSIAFGTLTLILAYFNIRLSNVKNSEEKKIELQNRYNKISAIILPIIFLLFLVSISLNLVILLSCK